ncbi:MAG: hypothetical protein JST11_26975 [Acidobacteria bacterium]|nr:hypothetical protein [Acidobacteriota bacterium]
MRNSTLRDNEYVVDVQLPSSSRVFDGCAFNWLEASWPAVALCLMIVAFVTVFDGPREKLLRAAGRVRDSVSPAIVLHNPEPDRVLILTTDPMHELAVVATLSPRGFEPLLARDLRSAKQQLSAHSSRVSFVVMDAAVPGAAAMARSLGGMLPAGHIVVLQPGVSRESIGQTLLNQL